MVIAITLAISGNPKLCGVAVFPILPWRRADCKAQGGSLGGEVISRLEIICDFCYNLVRQRRWFFGFSLLFRGNIICPLHLAENWIK
jgi:hypothetical protein